MAANLIKAGRKATELIRIIGDVIPIPADAEKAARIGEHLLEIAEDVGDALNPTDRHELDIARAHLRRRIDAHAEAVAKKLEDGQ